MPVSCKKIGGKFRIVGPNNQIEKNSKGTAVDGGGHSTDSACQRQARAINANTENVQRLLSLNVQSRPVLGDDIWELPEFQRLANRLGIPLDGTVSGVRIQLRAGELVQVAIEQDEPKLERG